MEKFKDVEYFEVETRNEKIILKPVKITPLITLEQIKEKIASLGLKEEDIEKSIQWARERQKKGSKYN